MVRVDAYGAPLSGVSGSGVQELFTGRWDEKQDLATGLVEMGVRPYGSTLGRFYGVDAVDGGSCNEYDYACQDPVNGYDLSGTICKSVTCVVNRAKKKVGQAQRGVAKARDVFLQVVQEVPYGVYYGSYTALDQAKRNGIRIPLAARAALVGTEAAGLAGDAAIDRLRGKSMWDDARPDSALPNYCCEPLESRMALWLSAWDGV